MLTSSFGPTSSGETESTASTTLGASAISTCDQGDSQGRLQISIVTIVTVMYIIL